MRILVVNAHGSSPDSKKSFENFLECVKEVLQSCVDTLAIEDGCIIRTKDDIDDYLFGDKSSFYSSASAKRFDALDIVLISGDSTLLPWSSSAYKITALMRMCLRVKKFMLVTGSAMEALVYIAASNLENAIKVINGKGRGSKIGDIGKMNIPIESIRTGLDCFLDAVTGDLYTVRHESVEWVPICNVGLHNVRLAQEYNTLGKYVIQAPVYRPKKGLQDRVQGHCFFESYEVLCYLKKASSNHWLFVNCNLEFTVPHKSKWQIHSFKFPDPAKTYEVIAESDDGPFIIEFPNIIGIKFEINKKYPETRQMIHNFIAKCSKEILGLKKSATTSILKEQGVEFSRAKRFIFKDNKNQDPEYVSGRTAIASGSIRSETLRMNRLYTSQTSRRSSIEIGQEQLESDDRKSVSRLRVKRKKADDQSGSNLPSIRADSVGRNHARSFSKPQSNVSSLLELYNDPPAVPVISYREVLSKNPEPSSDNKHTILRNAKPSPSPSSGLSRMTPSIKKLGAYHSTADFNFRDFPFSGKVLNSHNLLTKESIRRYLYPELCDLENNFDKKNWTPGNMTVDKKQIPERKKVRIAGFFNEQESRAKSPTKTPRDSADLNPYQTIRAADPYKSQEEVMRDYEKKESQKIIGSKAFITSAKRTATPNLELPNHRLFKINLDRIPQSGSLTSRF